MFGVQTLRLNGSVIRDHSRFSPDFMFQLNQDEFYSLISQNGISKNKRLGGARKLPYAFTEQGVAKWSGVLNSETVILVNILVIRVFTKMKQLLPDNKEFFLKIEKIERKLTEHDKVLQNIFIILKKLLLAPETTKGNPIAFPYPKKK